MKITLALVFALCLSVGVSAQCAADMTIGGSLMAGGDVSLSVSGAPADAMTLIFVSTDTGSFGITGLFTMGLSMPMIPVGVGSTDANGDFGVTINIPTLPASFSIASLDLHAQSLSIEFSGMTMPGSSGGSGGMGGGFTLPFTFCTSDVEAFTLTF